MSMESAQRARPGAAPTILVVENEAVTRLSTSEYLRDCGWTVMEAASGEAAQALFIAGGPIDVVFSDVEMSPQLCGIALAHWVHERHPRVHIMLTSGVASMSGVPSEVCAQTSTFRKPYLCADIATHIRHLMM